MYPEYSESKIEDDEDRLPPEIEDDEDRLPPEIEDDKIDDSDFELDSTSMEGESLRG